MHDYFSILYGNGKFRPLRGVEITPANGFKQRLTRAGFRFHHDERAAGITCVKMGVVRGDAGDEAIIKRQPVHQIAGMRACVPRNRPPTI